MKNKHLLILFLATAALGLLARRFPWFRAHVFQTDLIAVDTTSVTQISVFQSGEPELLLERTEGGWAAAQEMRAVTVAQEHIAPVLAALSSIRSLRIVRTAMPDTLGFSGKKRVQVVVLKEGDLLEQFEIGDEILENGQPATFIRLNRHEGVYLVESHLRGIFSKNLDDFRENTIARFDPSTVRAVALERPDSMPVFFQKNDSTGYWETPGKVAFPNDSVQIWLNLFTRLNGSPYADHFDESRARETLDSRITLYLATSDSLVFSVFYVKPPDLPEELPLSKIKTLPLYVLHSSQNAANYFAPPDTALLRRICRGVIPTDTGKRTVSGKTPNAQ